ncbi:hypothetical protein HMI54_008853 [Coelomomyces lativittatus]|nr:hypothetical protein HMI54_008853 [Coelomomyces lativittatus]
MTHKERFKEDIARSKHLHGEILFHLLKPLCIQALSSLSISSPHVSLLGFRQLFRALQLCLHHSPNPSFHHEQDVALLGVPFIQQWQSTLHSARMRFKCGFLPSQLANYLLFPCFQVLEHLHSSKTIKPSNESLLTVVLNIIDVIWTVGSPYQEKNVESFRLDEAWHLSLYSQSLSSILYVFVGSPSTKNSATPTFTSSLSEELQLRALKILRHLFFLSDSTSMKSVSVSLQKKTIFEKFKKTFLDPPSSLTSQFQFCILNEKSSSSSSSTFISLYSFLCSSPGISIIAPYITCIINIFSNPKLDLQLRQIALNTLYSILFERFGNISDSILPLVYPLLLSRIAHIHDLPSSHTSLLLESLPILLGMISRVLSDDTKVSEPVQETFLTVDFMKEKLKSLALNTTSHSNPTLDAEGASLPMTQLCSSTQSKLCVLPMSSFRKDEGWYFEAQRKTHVVLLKVIQALRSRSEHRPKLLMHAMIGFSMFLKYKSHTVLLKSSSLVYRFCTSFFFCESHEEEGVQWTDHCMQDLPSSTRYKEHALNEAILACHTLNGALDETKVQVLYQLASCLKYVSTSLPSKSVSSLLLLNTPRLYTALRGLFGIDTQAPLRTYIDLKSSLTCWNYTSFHTSSKVYLALSKCIYYLAQVGGIPFVERMAMISMSSSTLLDPQPCPNYPLTVHPNKGNAMGSPNGFNGTLSSQALSHVQPQACYAHWILLNHFMKHLYVESLVQEYCLRLKTTGDALEKSFFIEGLGLTVFPNLTLFFAKYLSTLFTYTVAKYRPLQVTSQLCLQSLLSQAKLTHMNELVNRYADYLVHDIYCQFTHLHVYPSAPQLMLAVLQSSHGDEAVSMFQNEAWMLMVHALSLNREQVGLWMSVFDIWMTFVQVTSSSKETKNEKEYVFKEKNEHNTGQDTETEMEDNHPPLWPSSLNIVLSVPKASSLSPTQPRPSSFLTTFFKLSNVSASINEEKDTLSEPHLLSSCPSFSSDDLTSTTQGHSMNPPFISTMGSIPEKESTIEEEGDDFNTSSTWSQVEKSYFFLLKQLHYLIQACPLQPCLLDRLLRLVTTLFQHLSSHPRTLQPWIYKFSQRFLRPSPMLNAILKMEHVKICLLQWMYVVVGIVPDYGAHVVRQFYLNDLLHMLSEYSATTRISSSSSMFFSLLIAVLTKLVHPSWTSLQLHRLFMHAFKYFQSPWVDHLFKEVLSTCGDLAWFQGYLMYCIGQEETHGAFVSSQDGPGSVSPQRWIPLTSSTDFSPPSFLGTPWKCFFSTMSPTLKTQLVTYLHAFLELKTLPESC